MESYGKIFELQSCGLEIGCQNSKKASNRSYWLDHSDGRDDRIRTCGLFVPNEARYQTVPHPDIRFSVYSDVARIPSVVVVLDFSENQQFACYKGF